MGVLLGSYREFFESLYGRPISWLSLTLRNMPALDPMHARLIRCWHRFLKHPAIRGKIRGGLVGYQATNQGKGWHDHLHGLVEADYINIEVIRSVWFGITGDSFEVDIRRTLDPLREFKYLLEYILGTDKVLSEFRDEYNRVFKGRRLLQPFGSWLGHCRASEKEFVCPDCGGSRWVGPFEDGQGMGKMVLRGIEDVQERVKFGVLRVMGLSPPCGATEGSGAFS